MTKLAADVCQSDVSASDIHFRSVEYNTEMTSALESACPDNIETKDAPDSTQAGTMGGTNSFF